MKSWVQINREAFERDVFRDFCLVSDSLDQQFERFADTGAVSFSVLRAMVGEPWDKGLLWRLKDKSHHIFLNREDAGVVAQLLDWTLGYIFHETLKLMEDAHQWQFYATRLSGLADSGFCPVPSGLLEALRVIQGETKESMRRESARLQTLLLHARKLFCLYFAGSGAHRPLARFLHDNNELVRRVFANDYAELIQSVYGDEPERLHLEAALSLLESARTSAAGAALRAALDLNPDCPEAESLKAATGLE
ncbi:hypothetical protein LJC15_03080 [Desulfovibrio sp. OttesenSCG-928-G11]|nr:hypothetical protein [Desulfovibrio sp. OttesenSCG-928-G11]